MRGTQSIVCILLSSLLTGQSVLELADKSGEYNMAYAQRLPRAGGPRLPDLFPGRAIPFDYDNDGDQDLFLTYGPLREDTTGFAMNRLYRNDGDHWVDVTVGTKLSAVPPAANAAVGDYDGDGYLDLYLSRLGPDILLRNNGGQEWVDVTAAAGIDNRAWSTAARFLDVNRDGFLDLYVANFVHYPELDTLTCKEARSGLEIVCDPDIYDQAANRLYLNDGAGRFIDKTDVLGFADSTSRSTDLIVFDANGDHWLDLLVISHRSANLLYQQLADTSWAESAWPSGLAMVPNGEERTWQQVLPLDANGDAMTDLLFVDSDHQLVLMLNHGGIFFKDVYQSGLFRPGELLTGSLALNLDVDFDNAADLMIVDAGNDTLAHTQYVLHFRPGGPFGQISTTIDLSIDTVITRPFVEIDTTTGLDDFLGVITGPVFDPSLTFETSADPLPMTAPDNPIDSPVIPDSLQIDSTLRATGWVDSLGHDGAMLTAADSVWLIPSPELADHWDLWDTLRVVEVPAQLVAADFDLDGVEEIVATYPSGVLKVWGQLVPRRLAFLGLLPRTQAPGETHVGARIRVTVKNSSWQGQVAGSEPMVVYLPPRTRQVAVQVIWPGGQVSSYDISEINRYYTLLPNGETLP